MVFQHTDKIPMLSMCGIIIYIKSKDHAPICEMKCKIEKTHRLDDIALTNRSCIMMMRQTCQRKFCCILHCCTYAKELVQERHLPLIFEIGR